MGSGHNYMKNGYAAALAVMTLALMGAIFLFSSHSGDESSGLSLKVTRVICRIVFFDYEDMTHDEQVFIVSGLHGFVRKLAHFSLYMLLGVCAYSALLLADFKFGGKWFAAWFACTAYAAFDEFHPSFTPGRSMKLTDVMIDSSGAVCGIIVTAVLYAAVGYWSYRRKNGNT